MLKGASMKTESQVANVLVLGNTSAGKKSLINSMIEHL